MRPFCKENPCFQGMKAWVFDRLYAFLFGSLFRRTVILRDFYASTDRIEVIPGGVGALTAHIADVIIEILRAASGGGLF